MERNPLLAETEQVGIILYVIACSEKKVGNRHRTKFRSSACGGKSFCAQLFSEFPERTIHYRIMRSTIKARKRKNRYMLDQRYICQATLLPAWRQTRQAPVRSQIPRTMAEKK